jgi:HprK-related kinase A
MRLTNDTQINLQTAIRGYGARCVIGPFSVHLRSTAPRFARTLALLYEGIPIELDPERHFNDFTVSLNRPHNLYRRYLRPQVTFASDSDTPFEPFPLDHGFPHFEWGLNWLIATRAHQYLMFHTAVLERHGKALMLPALPGSGKSTLCAALMLRGWRLLSDEFGLYRPETGLLEPLPRPIPLKNESIDIIRQYSENAVLGPTYPKTRKGDVAHLRPTASSIAAATQAAKPAWIVFPQYLAGATELLHPFAKGRAFLKLSGNSFNYRLQGARGFTAVADIIDTCDTWYLEFSDLDKAVALLTEMTDGPPPTGE